MTGSRGQREPRSYLPEGITPVYKNVFAFRAVPCYHAGMERLFDMQGPAGSRGSSRGRDARTHGNPAYYDKTRHLCGVVQSHGRGFLAAAIPNGAGGAPRTASRTATVRERAHRPSTPPHQFPRCRGRYRALPHGRGSVDRAGGVNRAATYSGESHLWTYGPRAS